MRLDEPHRAKLMDMKDSIDQSIYFFERLQKAIENGIAGEDERISNISDRRTSEALEQPISYKKAELVDVLAPLSRASVFLTIYGVVEHILMKVCQIVVEANLERGISIGMKDLAGSDFKKAQIYLSKVAGVSLPPYFSGSAEKYRVLRNHLTHSAGLLNKDAFKSMCKKKDAFKSMCKKIDKPRKKAGSYQFSKDSFEVRCEEDGQYRIALDYDFVYQFIDDVRAMFSVLLERCSDSKT